MNKTTNPNTDLILVLGMHKSGTSAVSSILKEMGYYLGEEDETDMPSELTHVMSDNIFGYFENTRIVDINDRLFKMRNCNFLNASKLNEKEITGPRYSPVLEDAGKVVNSLFAMSSKVSIKDPRTCLNLAFWNKVFPKYKAVVIFRNPASVAKSIEKRDKISFSAALEAWKTSNDAILEDDRLRDSLYISFENLVENPESTISLLCNFTGAEYQPYLPYLVEPTLDHNKAKTIEHDKNVAGVEKINSLYNRLLDLEKKSLRKYGSTEDSPDITKADEKLRVFFSERIKKPDSIIRAQREYVNLMNTQNEELMRELAEKEARINRLMKLPSVRIYKLISRIRRRVISWITKGR